MSTWRERLVNRFASDIVEQRVQAAVKVVDDRWWSQIGGASQPQDRQWGDLLTQLDDSLTAWRDNPLARRIVGLTTDYVVGDGIKVTSTRSEVQVFVDAFWAHPMNGMAGRLYSWCDELTRAGELFVVLFPNPGDGMQYVRTVPAVQIDEVDADREDLERELRYRMLQPGSVEGRWWPGRWLAGEGDPVMLHYCINRPLGGLRGESDLSVLLPWLRRYAGWAEDRVRVNRLRNSFVWQCRLTNASPADIQKKRAQYSVPPVPGSVIVSDANEEWAPLSASLQSSDAEADGKMLRLLIAAGAGVPLHFLSEGESATRATAAEMGGPTFRHYQHRQLAFADMLMDLVTVAASRAGFTGDLGLSVALPDLAREEDRGLDTEGGDDPGGSVPQNEREGQWVRSRGM